MLVGGVVEDQLGDDAQAALVGLADERLEVAQRAVLGLTLGVVGDVVAVVLQRRRIERQQPDRGDAQVLQVVELLGQPLEVADAVAVAVVEGADVQLVDDRVLVPERIVAELDDSPLAAAWPQSQRTRRLDGRVTASSAQRRDARAVALRIQLDRRCARPLPA